MALPAGYVYYMDPTDVSTITGTNPVTNITVKGSANSNYIFSAQAFGGLQSGGDYNGKNILVCDGSGGIQQAGAFTAASMPLTVVSVFRISTITGGGYAYVYQGGWSGAPLGLRVTPANLVETRPTAGNANSFQARTGVTVPLNTLVAIVVIRDGANSTCATYNLETGGTLIGTHTTDMTGATGPNVGPVILGSNNVDGTNHLQGNLGHFFIYDRALTGQEQTDIVDWLVAEWAGAAAPHPGSHTVTDISQAADPECIYFGQAPAIQVGDLFSFKETTETNGWGVSIDAQGFPVIDSSGATGTDSFLFNISRDSGSTWEPTPPASNTWTFTIAAAGIEYTLIPNSDGTQRTNYPNGDYAPEWNLPAPGSVTLSNIGTNQMTLNWSYPSSGTDATGFVVQMWVTGTSNTWTDVPAPNPTPLLAARSAVQSGLVSATQHKFRIAAVRGDIQGTFVEAWIDG